MDKTKRGEEESNWLSDENNIAFCCPFFSSRFAFRCQLVVSTVQSTVQWMVEQKKMQLDWTGTQWQYIIVSSTCRIASVVWG